MKIILTTNIKKLGKIGDQVNVKPGFARNFLFPNNMALRDNKKNLETYSKIKEEVQKKEQIKLEESKNLLEKISGIEIVFTKEADEKDQLYGSISKKEIIQYLDKNNIKIKSDDLIIRDQIKSIGEHKIQINPYIDVSEDFTLKVKKK